MQHHFGGIVVATGILVSVGSGQGADWAMHRWGVVVVVGVALALLEKLEREIQGRDFKVSDEAYL